MKKRKNRPVITAKEAAEMLNVPPQMIREHMKTGKGTFSKLGTVKKINRNYTYMILRSRVEKFIKENCK